MSTTKRKKTIVVIDDDPDILLTLKLSLEREGYRVKTAESVSDLLDKPLKPAPDLILLDVMLPWMSGYDLCYALKAQHNHCPVIMISARSQRVDIERGFWSGADDYFTKPLDLNVLLAKIEALTEASEAR